MKFAKILAALFLSVYASGAVADNVIQMVRKDKAGYNEPVYYKKDSLYDWNDRFSIVSLCDPDNFPFSSDSQGSIFAKIFQDMAEQEHIVVSYKYPRQEYQQSVKNFEKGIIEFMSDVNTLFGVYYENISYSKNEYVYPAFFENKVHIIMPSHKIINAKNKEELKNYRGGYVAADRFSSFVLKDFSTLKMTEIKDFATAYEKLLTGSLDYIAASYYKSMIELYKLGIREYVVYSKEPLWKMPMFLRTTKELSDSPRMGEYRKYIKSARYKKIRDDAFQELLDIYRENTKGIVPPTYITQVPPPENQQETATVPEEESEFPTVALPLSVHEEQRLEN